MMMARRFDGLGNGYDGTTRRHKGKTDWTGVVYQHEDRLQEPLSWQKSRLVFVDSMSDLFHPAVSEAFIDKVFGVMALATGHVFQILTKRPGRMKDYLEPAREELVSRWTDAMREVAGHQEDPGYPLENVWLGTSVEDEEATGRIDELREVDAQVRFVSFEPLVGKIEDPDLSGIDWAIVGGESGHDATELEESWVRLIKQACDDYDVPFFFKQWGGRYSKEKGRVFDDRYWNEMPSDKVPSQVAV
jgi:protein gp37